MLFVSFLLLCFWWIKGSTFSLHIKMTCRTPSKNLIARLRIQGRKKESTSEVTNAPVVFGLKIDGNRIFVARTFTRRRDLSWLKWGWTIFVRENARKHSKFLVLFVDDLLLIGNDDASHGKWLVVMGKLKKKKGTLLYFYYSVE